MKSPRPCAGKNRHSRRLNFSCVIASICLIVVGAAAEEPTKEVVVLTGCALNHTAVITFQQILTPGVSNDSSAFANASMYGQTFWGYTWYAAALMLLVQSGLIVWLLFTRARDRQTENRKRESEERCRAVVRGVSDLMFVQTIDGVYVDYQANNPANLLVPAEQFLGKNMRDVLPPQLANDILECFQRVKNGEMQVIEYQLPINDIARWFEARMVLSGSNILSIISDVTERNRTIDELRKSEERFATAFRANPQSMSLTTLPGGVYVDVNDNFLAMSGYTREELIGHTSLELNVWETVTDRAAFFHQLNEEGSVVNYEMKFRRKDGAIRTLLLSAEKLEIVGEKCILVASTDIAERMRTEQELRESEARFRNMADTAPVMIWVSDESNACTYFNKQWLDFTGRTLDQELNQGWAEGVHADDYARCMEIYVSSFDKRVPFEMEYRLRDKAGQYRWVLDTATPRFASDGAFLGYVGSCIDITERKHSEVQLQKAHEELHQLKNLLEAENIYLQEELQLDQTFGEIVGQSDSIKQVLFNVSQVAPTDATVLISGETGTGKELVARAIHKASSRKDRPLIKVNCGALAPTLIESELFGHEKGAFTGASMRQAGRFELANGGTLFLDEVGELPLELQVKLLRVIQENEFERLGSTKTIKVDVRIIAATNRNLRLEVEKGNFREDLWYRLNVYPITMPPLRQRKEDIPLLVEHFTNWYATKFGKTIASISPRAMQILQAHSWPGNIRELANVVERAVIHTKGSVLKVLDRFEEVAEDPSSAVKTLEEVEREHITRVLENTGWRIEGPHGAAKVLGLNPSTLRTRMLKLGIPRRTATSM